MGITVAELINSSDKQAEGMKIIADSCPTAASVSLMDLSLEAEAFGSTIVYLMMRFQPLSVPSFPLKKRQRLSKFRKSVQVVPRFILMLSKKHANSSQIVPVLAGVIGPFLPGRQTFGRIRSTDLLLRRAGYGTYRSAESN